MKCSILKFENLSVHNRAFMAWNVALCLFLYDVPMYKLCMEARRIRPFRFSMERTSYYNNARFLAASFSFKRHGLECCSLLVSTRRPNVKIMHGSFGEFARSGSHVASIKLFFNNFDKQ
ncbi:uncharacterized protein LOC132165595 isoform X4 [Corylus avellana]|uniref:uncharacterized protein LOC132165595 isoform X4 n=1 Tax=Corylus avellana TaxID=13451 RepID=UPI00286C6CC9|nr:uncharacterized protein LOC132165595 isoform X4 [Corylus avellana]